MYLEAGYNTLLELEAEGVTFDPDLPADAERAIKIGMLAARYIDKMTRRSFVPVTATVKLDYKPGTATIFLPQPAIAVTAVRILGVALTDDAYVLYNRNTKMQDERDNPRIELVSGWGGINPDRSPYRNIETWRRSYPQGIEIDGTWGYCDLDETTGDPETPMMIKLAHAKLCERLIPRAVDPMAAETRRQERITGESGGGRSYSMINLITRNSPTGDPEIDDMISQFTAPLRMGG